jgi:alpha-tubulin suppressor-like RCC1 family protein
LDFEPLRSRLAAFYFRHLAALGGEVLDWAGDEPPRRVAIDAAHVAVAKDESYAIDRSARLLAWTPATEPRPILESVAYAAAGESRVLAVLRDGTLVSRRRTEHDWREEARGVAQAWVGDSSDYYVTLDGRLFAAGLAHRGQYGDGLLAAVDGWKQVAEGVAFACAHTGHAVLLRRDGTVEGTGGNRFGPLGRHGFGDKADRWGPIFAGAVRVATGARHTLAIDRGRALWIWGENESLDPKQVLRGVVDIAAGDCESLALTDDGRLWRWRTGAAPAPAVAP